MSSNWQQHVPSNIVVLHDERVQRLSRVASAAGQRPQPASRHHSWTMMMTIRRMRSKQMHF